MTAVSMLSYLPIGHRYRPPSSLSIRQHFTFATACSTAERILLKLALNLRCQSCSSVPPTRFERRDRDAVDPYIP